MCHNCAENNAIIDHYSSSLHRKKVIYIVRMGGGRLMKNGLPPIHPNSHLA